VRNELQAGKVIGYSERASKDMKALPWPHDEYNRRKTGTKKRISKTHVRLVESYLNDGELRQLRIKSDTHRKLEKGNAMLQAYQQE
jgi:hypothetical protein